MSAQRIQRKRTKGWRMPPRAIYVGRPTYWGNPYRVGQRHEWAEGKPYPWPTPIIRGYRRHDADVVRCESITMAVLWYEAWISTNIISRDAPVYLAGHDLCCWCPLDQPCHADVLLRLANPEAAS